MLVCGWASVWVKRTFSDAGSSSQGQDFRFLSGRNENVRTKRRYEHFKQVKTRSNSSNSTNTKRVIISAERNESISVLKRKHERRFERPVWRWDPSKDGRQGNSRRPSQECLASRLFGKVTSQGAGEPLRFAALTSRSASPRRWRHDKAHAAPPPEGKTERQGNKRSSGSPCHGLLTPNTSIFIKGKHAALEQLLRSTDFILPDHIGDFKSQLLGSS